MKRSCFLLLVFLFSGVLAGFAQSNKLIDGVLGQKEADYSTTIYLVLSAAGIVPESATVEDAVKVLGEKNWGIAQPDPSATISLGQYSYLLMKAFDIEGGLMYRLLPGPRYAPREVAYLGFVTDRPTPYRSVSGEEVLRILGMVLSWKEERS